jgi:hypothetical protein
MGLGGSLKEVKKKKRWGYQRFFILTQTVDAVRLMLSKNVQ